MAAPFGSQEDLLLTTGVAGRDYTIGADGNPIPTELSNVDANSVPWKYLAQRPQVAYWPGIPDYAKAAIDFEKAVMPIGIQDPTIGMTTPAIDKLGASLHAAAAGRALRPGHGPPSDDRLRPGRQGMAVQAAATRSARSCSKRSPRARNNR